MSEAPVLEAAQRKLKAKRARLGVESTRPPSQNEAPQLLLPQDPQASAIQGLEIADARSDPYATLVPEGDYHVIYLRFERGYVYGRAVWFCHFRISEGEHAGRTILRFYNQPKGSRLARTSALWRDFVCLTGRRPPTGGFRPSWLLSDCEVLAHVVTVSERPEGGKRVPMAPCEQYSKIDHFISIAAGAPPVLRGISGGLLRRPRT